MCVLTAHHIEARFVVASNFTSKMFQYVEKIGCSTIGYGVKGLISRG